MTDFEVTGLAQKQAWADGVLPPVEQVRPGIFSIPVPIPDNPLRYLLSYCFRTDDGVVLVDCGWPVEEAWQALMAGLDAVGAAVTDVRGVVLTHAHLDHHGLAPRLREASGCWVAMHPAEAEGLRLQRDRSNAAAVETNHAWLRLTGVPAGKFDDLVMTPSRVREFSDLEPDWTFDDKEVLPVKGWTLRTQWTPGHTPGHTCFDVEGQDLLLTGDHLLPRITPNISSYKLEFSDPLGQYLDSLAAMRETTAEALPGHEYRFAGVRARADQVVAHHNARLDEVSAIVAERVEVTAWEVAQGLSWSRDWSTFTPFLQRSALAETLAHLRYLAGRGRLVGVAGPPSRWRLS